MEEGVLEATEDGLYYSSAARDRPHLRRAKKAAVALVGLGALSAGGYFATMLLTGVQQASTMRDPGPYAAVTPTPSASPTKPAKASPGPRTGTKAAAPVSLLPSPTPSVRELSDEVVAAAQVSRLVQAAPRPTASGIVTAGDPVVVNTVVGADGSQIRVVSARYQLSDRRQLLVAADDGQVVGNARCTRRVRVDATVQVRPTLLLCWRTEAGRSVVTVATKPATRPSAAASAAVLDQQWRAMG